jgi:hypothetical protein
MLETGAVVSGGIARPGTLEINLRGLRELCINIILGVTPQLSQAGWPLRSSATVQEA